MIENFVLLGKSETGKKHTGVDKASDSVDAFLAVSKQVDIVKNWPNSDKNVLVQLGSDDNLPVESAKNAHDHDKLGEPVDIISEHFLDSKEDVYSSSEIKESEREIKSFGSEANLNADIEKLTSSISESIGFYGSKSFSSFEMSSSKEEVSLSEKELVIGLSDKKKEKHLDGQASSVEFAGVKEKLNKLLSVDVPYLKALKAAPLKRGDDLPITLSDEYKKVDTSLELTGPGRLSGGGLKDSVDVLVSGELSPHSKIVLGDVDSKDPLVRARKDSVDVLASGELSSHSKIVLGDVDSKDPLVHARKDSVDVLASGELSSHSKIVLGDVDSKDPLVHARKDSVDVLASGELSSHSKIVLGDVDSKDPLVHARKDSVDVLASSSNVEVKLTKTSLKPNTNLLGVGEMVQNAELRGESQKSNYMVSDISEVKRKSKIDDSMFVPAPNSTFKSVGYKGVDSGGNRVSVSEVPSEKEPKADFLKKSREISDKVDLNIQGDFTVLKDKEELVKSQLISEQYSLKKSQEKIINIQNFNKVVAQSIKEGVTSMSIKLKPLELGTVDVIVKEVSGEMQVFFKAEKPETLLSLSENENQLRQELGDSTSMDMSFKFGGEPSFESAEDDNDLADSGGVDESIKQREILSDSHRLLNIVV